MTSGTYRLVGVGKCTKGLKHALLAGQPVVIGRHSTCTLVLTRVPDSASDFEYISRQHVVIEEDPKQGWSVRDNGSRNGTAILPGGLLPAVRLTAGDYQPLNDGDVIELADSEEFRFAYQKIEAPEVVSDPEVEAKTGHLIRSE